MSDALLAEKPLSIPEELDILPLFGTVLYPLVVSPLAVGQPAAVRLLDSTTNGACLVGLVALRAEDHRPDPIYPDDCYRTGIVALVHRLLRLPDDTLRVAIQGLERIEIVEFLTTQPTLRARVRLLPEQEAVRDSLTAVLMRSLVDQMHQMLPFIPGINQELLDEIENEEDPRRLAYLIATAGLVRKSVADRQHVLDLSGVRIRLERLNALLAAELEDLRSGWSMSADLSDHTGQAELSLYASSDMPHASETRYAERPGSVLWLRGASDGGECVVIEAAQMPGSKGFLLTGQRSTALRDAAYLALSWVRSQAAQLGLPLHFYDQIDLHVHIPAGISSADDAAGGVAIATALVSLLTDRPTVANLGLAGEITLHGRLLPVGNIGEKVLAAQHKGIRRFVLPAGNHDDLLTLPADMRAGLSFVFVEHMEQVLVTALRPYSVV